MNTSYLQFIETIENNFQDLQASYLKLSAALNGEDAKAFKNLRAKWQAENQTESALSSILKTLSDYDDNNEFPKQIKACLLNNQIGIIEYTKIVMERQYKFILNQFPDTVYYYNNYNDDVIDLLDQLYNQNDILNDLDFLKAVQIQFIEGFLYFEDEFISAYPLYQRREFNKNRVYTEGVNTEMDFDDDDLEDEFIEPIMLDYNREDKAEIINLMYATLNNVFIEAMPFEEFSSYFESENISKKIQWKVNDLELAFLFNGIEAPVTFNQTGFVKIKISNDPIKLICRTFKKRNGNPFYSKNVADNLRNGRNPKDKNRVDDRLTDLIIQISDKYK